MAFEDPVIIELRLNETSRREAGNPHVPYSPDEIVAQAKSAGEAGASILHWHARDPDTGDPIHTVQPYLDVIDQMRRDTDLLLHPTLGYTAATAVEDRVAHILAARERGTPVDLAPIDFGSVDVDAWDDTTQRFVPGDNTYANHRSSITQVLETFRDNDVPGVVAACWHPGQVRTALKFREAGLLPTSILWEFAFTGDALPAGAGERDFRALEAMAAAVPDGEPWLVLCFMGDVMPLAAQAITMGGHVAVGTGDHPFTRLGAPDNGELVRRVADLAETIGRPVASIADTRRLIGLPESAS
jgi:3-keto-5-aminohexanoate cleavage enzyme